MFSSSLNIVLPSLGFLLFNCFKDMACSFAEILSLRE